MPKITFVLNDRSATCVNAPAGRSLMQVAVDNEIKGIVADCDGLCACSTCQVLIDDVWFKVCDPPDELEQAMIEHAYDPQTNSRLACQIRLSDAHDGMVVTGEIIASGSGASNGKDGVDVIETDVTNCMNLPVEALEMDAPIRVHRSELSADSGGAGAYRGGLGRLLAHRGPGPPRSCWSS